MRCDVPDIAVAFFSSAALLLSSVSFLLLILFRLLTRRHSRRRPLRRLSRQWPLRLVLLLSASLLPIPELLRLHHLLPCFPLTLASQSLLEPSLLASLLLLLRADSPNLPLAAVLLFSLPFLAINALVLSVDLGFPEGFVAPSARCYPLFGTLLLAAMAAAYVPVFVSAAWGAVSAVINKRLRNRLYALVAAVVAALSVQVAALALSALFAAGGKAARWLEVVAVAAVLTCAAAGELILVVLPIVDALAVGDALPTGDGMDGG